MPLTTCHDPEATIVIRKYYFFCYKYCSKGNLDGVTNEPMALMFCLNSRALFLTLSEKFTQAPHILSIPRIWEMVTKFDPESGFLIPYSDPPTSVASIISVQVTILQIRSS